MGPAIAAAFHLRPQVAGQTVEWSAVKEGVKRRQTALIAGHELHVVLVAQQLPALAVFGDPDSGKLPVCHKRCKRA